MFPLYKIVANVVMGKLSHVILHRVDSTSKEILETFVKIKVGKDLKDETNNHFKVNGYYGDYIILRSEHLGSHPVGIYLTEK
jgi:hypothetical protein